MRYKKPSNKAPEKMLEKKQFCEEDTRVDRHAEGNACACKEGGAQAGRTESTREVGAHIIGNM